VPSVHTEGLGKILTTIIETGHKGWHKYFGFRDNFSCDMKRCVLNDYAYVKFSGKEDW
jgi:hypothetical protein